MRKVLKISPQTYVRATQGDKILFRIPKDKLSEPGHKRLLRLEKYNQYKFDLAGYAKSVRLDLPMQGAIIRFFVPVPKTWRKWKKIEMDGKPHQAKPDLSNMLKALEDALFAEDKAISHYAEVSKYWVNHEKGWIEVISTEFTSCTIKNPYTTHTDTLI
jgi:Holliday junction resolvase RusA-like endonuclease